MHPFFLALVFVITLHRSSVGNIKGRVPQGSVLGPLLFILYINDITEDIQSLSRLFADDTSLSYSSSNINEIEQRLNSDIMKIYNPVKFNFEFT
jgi:hypothetical protein